MFAIIEPNLQFAQPLEKRTRTESIVLHHAAISRCTIEYIHNRHLDEGKAGCGYHFFVSKDGHVYRGRPINTVGVHAGVYNNRTIGICVEGNYEMDVFMPDAQKTAIVDLLVYLRKQYGKIRVLKHKDLAAVKCPGKNFPLNDIINDVITEETKLFQDVPADHKVAKEIERISKLGLMIDDGSGNFHPDDFITRAQLAKVLDRLLDMLGK